MKQKIVDEILKHNNENNQTVVQIATGIGKYSIIESLVTEFIQNKRFIRLLILTDRYELQIQFQQIIQKIISKIKPINLSYKIEKYDELKEDICLSGYNYIIFDNADSISKEVYETICKINEESKKILFYTRKNEWLDEMRNFQYVFKHIETYDINNEDMYIDIFRRIGFDNIKRQVAIEKDGIIMNADFEITKGENIVVVNVVNYKDRFVSKDIIDNIITNIILLKRVTMFQPKSIQICLILTCEIDDKIKEGLYEKYNATILDIRNLIYICQSNNKLIEQLEKSVFYPINNIKAEVPINKIFEIPKNYEMQIDIKEKEYKTKRLIEELLNIKPGKQDKSDKEYEKTCTKIIKYLFESEFTQMKEQLETDDDLFIMDLICGIKGSKSFWRILIEHYNTRFIVFEYKNYSEELKQNNIVITEKYLFNSALRNVAIVISRFRIFKKCN